MTTTPEAVRHPPTPTTSGSSGIGDPAAPARRYNIEILLISFAALLLEVSYTRIISFKLFYYYTYLVIGLALLGIGCGGVVVSLSGRLRRASTDAILMWSLLLGAASVGIGYLVVTQIPIATLQIWEYGTRGSILNVGRLLLICVALFASFIAIGIMIATLFARQPHRIGRLYFADLLGAGLACALVVYLLDSIGPPATILAAGLVLALLGLSLAWRARGASTAATARSLPFGAVVAVLLLVPLIAPGLLPDERADDVKTTLSAADSVHSEWSSIFRVDATATQDQLVLYHDGLQGSGIFEYDGDPTTLDRFDTDPRSLPFAVLDRAPSDVLIVGAAGGNEILATLRYDVGHVDAVELNPVTHSLVTGKYADYSGNIADDPRVNYVHGDGRSYLSRSDKDYDLVWYPAPDSYAASNVATAGAFVLSESYLYTSETIEESLSNLGPDGIVTAQFGEVDYVNKPNRTTRYVSTARHALAELGIDDPTEHLLVATSPTDLGASKVSTILVKKSPFTPEEVTRFTDQMANIPGTELQYGPGGTYETNPVSELVTVPGDELDDWYDSYPFDVRPITDDGPFFWHFTPFGDVVRTIGDRVDPFNPEGATGERVLLLLLAVATLFAAAFLLLPFITIRRTWAALPRKGRSALYFASLGVGFLFFEITLIQRLTLFLGYPTYSLTVTLASILIFTGVGALLSDRYKHAPQRALPVLAVTVIVLTAFYVFGLTSVTDAALGWPLMARVVVAFALLAPLGICLGSFMPLGLGVVASMTEDHSREYVAWGWAVNGFASVIGSVLTTILAMEFGFEVVLIIALVTYLVALATLRSLIGSRAAVTAAA